MKKNFIYLFMIFFNTHTFNPFTLPSETDFVAHVIDNLEQETPSKEFSDVIANLQEELPKNNNVFPTERKKKKRKRKKQETYRCSSCDKEFSTAVILRGHRDREHSKNTFNCDQCEKKYPLHTSLSLHLRSHHPEKRNDPLLACENSCGREFAWSATKNHHENYTCKRRKIGITN